MTLYLRVYGQNSVEIQKRVKTITVYRTCESRTMWYT